jgi:guanylate kinase
VFGGGDWYGTLESEVAPRLAAGEWVVLEIDVEGTRLILRQYPDAITIFVRPESMEQLERRLRSRATETEEATQRRLEVARRELAQADLYRYEVTNQTVNQAVDEILNILKRD